MNECSNNSGFSGDKAESENGWHVGVGGRVDAQGLQNQ